METNWNQLIERYLNNELSAEGKTAFESELAQNPELQKEFELHRLTKELIQRNSLRTLVQESGKQFYLKKVLRNSGIALIITGVIAAAVYFLAVRPGASADHREVQILEQSILEQMENSLAFEQVDPQYFQFTGKPDVFLSESGVLLSLTDESFLLDGKPYAGEAIVQWQEAQTAAEIVKAGLSTLSGNRLLETQGMFSLNAFTPEGKQLQLTEKGVYVQVPVDELKKDMKLFTGVPGKDGRIDWQNPVELERLPKQKDMSKMDLFPPRYEPKLNELKWYREKSKRDSLYLSFEEEVPASDTTATIPDNIQMYTQPKIESPKRISETPYTGATQISIMLPPRSQDELRPRQTPIERPEDKVHWSFDVQSLKNNEAVIIATVTMEPAWKINAFDIPKGFFGIETRFGLVETPKFKLVGKPTEPEPILYHDKASDEKMACHSGTVQFKQKVKLISGKPVSLSGFYGYQTCNNSHCLPPFEGTFSVEVNGEAPKNHIPPSKVLAIWKKQFNNTNLATQDFEDRMKEIHGTCDEQVFDVYANNLNESLWKLDERVVNMGYSQFRRFADQKVGKVNMDDVHQKNLYAFYEKAVETLRETGRKNVEAALKKERQWDDALMQERDQEVLRQGVRANLNASAEADFNLAHISKQLGQTVGFAITGETVASRDRHISRNWPAAPVKQSLPIAVNIDRLTKDLLSSRKSVDVFSRNKDKTARIRYADFIAKVESSGDYERLYFYLLPEQLNSYERLDFVNGKLNYPLNGAISYSGLAFGMNEKGCYLFEIPNLGARDLGAIKLQKVSDRQFETRLMELNRNRGVYSQQAAAEIGWLFKEKANYAVQKQRRANQQFRDAVRPTIYTCLRDATPAAVQSQSEAKWGQVQPVEKMKQELIALPDTPPNFPGGMTAFRNFISERVHYPEKAMEKNISGTVLLKLVIGPDGKVEQATPEREIPNYPEFTAEAIRVVKEIQKFNPGMLNGAPVRSEFRIPIKFDLK